jgi:hypothetical protein
METVPFLADYSKLYGHLLDMDCFDKIPMFHADRDTLSVYPHALFQQLYTVTEDKATYVGENPDFPYQKEYHFKTTRMFTLRLFDYFESQKPFVMRMQFFEFVPKNFHVTMLYCNGKRLTFVDSLYDVENSGEWFSYTRDFSALLRAICKVYNIKYESPDKMFRFLTPPQILENEWLDKDMDDKLLTLAEHKTLEKIGLHDEGGTCIMWSASIVNTMIKHNLSGAKWADMYLHTYGPKPEGAIAYIKHTLQKYFKKCDITPSQAKAFWNSM